MSNWFFLLPPELEKHEVWLEGELFHHLKALRLEEGDELVLSDGQGGAWRARLESVTPEGALAVVLGSLKGAAEPPLQITLYPGVPKGEKMDQLVRQAVELGTGRVVPLLTQRTVVRLDEAGGRKKTERWQRVARAAASQCRRAVLPEVYPPAEMENAVEMLREEGLVIVPWEEERSCNLAGLQEEFPSPPSVGIVTGPEGGLSPGEIDLLTGLENARTVSLGPRILRAETAPLLVLSIVQYLWGDVGKK